MDNEVVITNEIIVIDNASQYLKDGCKGPFQNNRYWQMEGYFKNIYVESNFIQSRVFLN